MSREMVCHRMRHAELRSRSGRSAGASRRGAGLRSRDGSPGSHRIRLILPDQIIPLRRALAPKICAHSGAGSLKNVRHGLPAGGSSLLSAVDSRKRRSRSAAEAFCVPGCPWEPERCGPDCRREAKMRVRVAGEAELDALRACRVPVWQRRQWHIREPVDLPCDFKRDGACTGKSRKVWGSAWLLRSSLRSWRGVQASGGGPGLSLSLLG